MDADPGGLGGLPGAGVRRALLALLAPLAGCPGPDKAHEVWQPAPGTSWQWQLSGTPDTSVEVEMFDLDLFDAPDSALDRLQERDVAVICYFSAGTVEDWREDVGDLPDEAIGEPLPEWEGERWLDVSHPAVRALAESRLDLALERGCDGVEPDNVDGYANDNGLGLTADDQLSFNRALAEAAHSRGLSVGLKNDLDQLEALEPHFDWALNEECAAYDECDRLAVFTDAGKAAFHVEYVDDWDEAEAAAAALCGVGPQLDTLIKPWDLDARRIACP